MRKFLAFIGVLAMVLVVALLIVAAFAVDSDETIAETESWNRAVASYDNGDTTNALEVLNRLILSKKYGARAAEVVAKIELERGNREDAAKLAQSALRAAPQDAKANRNFTRATDGLLERRETDHINAVIKATQGKDPGALLQAATADARRLLQDSGTYRTNAPARVVALADRLSATAEKMADVWIPVREIITQSVTNQEQAATILVQVQQAEAKTKKAAVELGNLDGSAYSTLSDVEHDFTRFLKQTILPPAAIDEDLLAQTNAWLDVEPVNGRPWQPEALDYTRAFRARFPAWARAYEQQVQSDTNKPPFTADDQAKVSALATELEKLQIALAEKVVPPDQQKALALLEQIRALLPKDKNGGGQNQQQQQNQQQNKDQQQNPNKDQQQNQDQDQQQDQKQEQDPNQQPPEEKKDESAGEEKEPTKEEQELEATLKKAQERNDEHEAEKKARMRKAPLPPNERDW